NTRRLRRPPLPASSGRLMTAEAERFPASASPAPPLSTFGQSPAACTLLLQKRLAIARDSATGSCTLEPTFKGVWSTVVNFALWPPHETKPGQYPQPQKRSDDSLGRHALGGWTYCPQRSVRVSLA